MVENTLEILGSEWGGGKCMEKCGLQPLCWMHLLLGGITSQSSGLLSVLCRFYVVFSSFLQLEHQ